MSEKTPCKPFLEGVIITGRGTQSCAGSVTVLACWVWMDHGRKKGQRWCFTASKRHLNGVYTRETEDKCKICDRSLVWLEYVAVPKVAMVLEMEI